MTEYRCNAKGVAPNPTRVARAYPSVTPAVGSIYALPGAKLAEPHADNSNVENTMHIKKSIFFIMSEILLLTTFR